MLLSLKEILGDKFNTLIDQFREDGAQRVAALGPAVRDRDFDTINRQAHGLKGSARNIGANALAEDCEVMEKAGREQRADNLEQTLAAIEQKFAATAAELDSHRQ